MTIETTRGRSTRVSRNRTGSPGRVPLTARLSARVGARLTGRGTGQDPEAGLATAEYAIATVAAAGFAGLLIAVLKSAAVREMLTGIISSALSVG